MWEEQLHEDFHGITKHKVLEHNKHFAPEYDFKLKLNHLGDMLRQEIISSMTDITAIYIPPDDDKVAVSSVDWRKKGAVTGVKNQGSVLRGWHSQQVLYTTGTFTKASFLWGIFSSRIGAVVISLQFIVCYHHPKEMIPPTRPTAICVKDARVTMDYATYIMQNNGIDSESYYPYEARRIMCVATTQLLWPRFGARSIPTGDEMALKAKVANIGPVS
ncbi:Cathepsin K-like, partial [Homarus americanus]